MKVVPLRSRSAHAAAAFLAAIVLLASSAPPARAMDQSISLLDIVDHGVRLISASVPVTPDHAGGSYSPPGSWTMLRVRMISDSGARDVIVRLVVGDQRWSTTAHLSVGTVGEADLALPPTAVGHVEGTPPERLSIVGEGGEMASAQFASSLPSGAYVTWQQTVGFHPAPVDEARRIMVGSRRDCPTGWAPVDEGAMAALGRHLECLDSTAVIAAPGPASKWLALPGIASWVRAGGLLLTPGEPHWTQYGAGAVAATPSASLSNLEFIDRIVLTTRGSLSLYDRSPGRYSDHRPDFDSRPDPGAFPQSDVPTGALAILLGLYLLILLPCSYFLLRRMRRKEMAWVMAPALALAFSAGIAALCFALKGVSTAVGRVSVVEETSPGVYLADDYVSIFSPRSTAASLSLPPGALPDTLLPNYYQWTLARQEIEVSDAPQGTLVDGLQLSQWTSRSIAYTSTPPVHGAIIASATCNALPTWTASIRNDSSLDLEECRVWTGAGWLMVGGVRSGQAKTISGALRRPLLDEKAPRGRGFGERIRQDELSNLLSLAGKHRLFFEGWTRQPLQSATVRGVSRYSDESIIIAPLTVVRGPEGLMAPLDLMPSVALCNSDDRDTGGMAGATTGYPGAYAGYPGASSPPLAAIEDSANPGDGLEAIHLPAGIHPASDRLVFRTRMWDDPSRSMGHNQVRCSVWNAAAHRWDPALRIDAHGRTYAKQYRLADYVTGPPGAANPMLYFKVVGDDNHLYREIESISPTSERVIVFLEGN